jgi:hypothetical protein
MSIVQITDGHGRLAWWAPLRIIALLAHPDDEVAREEFFEALAANAMIAVQAEETRDPIVVQMASGRLDRAFSGVGGGCAIAGDLLLGILSAAYHQPQHASVRRAVTAWARQRARQGSCRASGSGEPADGQGHLGALQTDRASVRCVANPSSRPGWAVSTGPDRQRHVDKLSRSG